MSPAHGRLLQSAGHPFAKSSVAVHWCQASLSLPTCSRSDVLYDAGMDLGKWVLAARTRKGMTQTQLGALLFVTKANVSGWENNRHPPSYHQLCKISELTGHPLEAPKAAPQATGTSETELALLEDIRVLPHDEREALRADLRKRAEKYRSYVNEKLKQLSGKTG